MDAVDVKNTGYNTKNLSKKEMDEQRKLRKRSKPAEDKVSKDLSKRRKMGEAELNEDKAEKKEEGAAKPETPWEQAGKKMCSLRDKELGICESC